MEGQQVEEGQCHQVGVREQLTRDSLHSTGSGGGGKELVTGMGSLRANRKLSSSNHSNCCSLADAGDA